MAFCPNCGTQIGDRAEHCPNCGHLNEARPPVAATRPLAGFWIRFLGVLIDAIIISIAGAFFGGTQVVRDSGEFGTRVMVNYRPAGTLIFFLYTWLMLGLNDGKTVGAMALGLRVAKPDGDRLGLGLSAARQAMAIVSGAVILVGYLWAAWDREKRTWHDLVAGSRVFRTR